MSHAELGNYLNGLGGLVVLTLGTLVLVPKPRTRAAVAFGAFAMGFGGNYALSHLIQILHLPLAGWGAVAGLVINGLWVGGGVAMLFVFPRPVTRREWPALLAALLVLAAFIGLATIGYQPATGIAIAGSLLGLATTGVLYALLFVLPLRFLLAKDAEVRRQAAFTAGGLALFVGYQAGAGTAFDASASVFGAEGPDLVRAVARLATALAVAVIWLVGTSRPQPEGRAARHVAHTTLAMVLIGLVAAALDLSGGHGIARVLMTLAIAYGIVRHQLLGLDVKLRWTLSKSTIAAAFITVFFIASEAGQQFFGETLGSTYVGIAAAGALVFALAPLQRVAEQLAEKAVPVQAAAPAAAHPTASDARTRAYRAAVRAALNDGALNAEEEHHLAEVAQHLGIGALDALRLRREVESEAAVGV